MNSFICFFYVLPNAMDQKGHLLGRNVDDRRRQSLQISICNVGNESMLFAKFEQRF